MLAPRLNGGFIEWNGFSRLQNPSDRLSNGNLGTGLLLYTSQHAITRRLDLHDGFVGFYFKERLALTDAVAFFLFPGDELSSLLRHFESGHDNADGHRFGGGRIRS
jgi:hypothetical protein